MKPSLKRILFYVVFLVLVFAPAVAMVLNWKNRNPLLEISVLLGFIGLALAGTQLIQISKLHFLSDALDMDAVYRNHHKLSLLSIALVLTHPLILIVTNMLNRPIWGWTVVAGWIGLASLLLIGLTSVARLKLKLSYTLWLVLHDLFTAAIIVFGLIHLFKVDYYMSQPQVKWVWIVEIVIWALLILWIRVLHPLLVGSKPFVVESVIAESKDTYSLNLKPQGHKGFKFEAGQIAWISVDKSPFIISRNPFSFAGSSEAPDGKLRFSIKAIGDFTKKIPALKPGDRVFVDGPYGAFNTHDARAEKGFVLIAGGIGLAPVMSIVNTLADRKDKRPVYVFYGDLNEDTVLYRKELENLQSRLNLKLVIALENPHDKSYLPCGYISKQLLGETLPENKKELMYFICGPMPMLKAMEKHLDFHGIPKTQIKEEKYEMA
ncbi:MAG: hypothetical protein WBI14_01955 [Anaerolineaceae bacterium]